MRRGAPANGSPSTSSTTTLPATSMTASDSSTSKPLGCITTWFGRALLRKHRLVLRSRLVVADRDDEQLGEREVGALELVHSLGEDELGRSDEEERERCALRTCQGVSPAAGDAEGIFDDFLERHAHLIAVGQRDFERLSLERLRRFQSELTKIHS